MASRVVVLHQGRIEQVGTPRMVYDYPDSMFVASFLGHYPMNFISAAFYREQSCIGLNTGTELPMPRFTMHPIDDEPLVLGLRPEHLKMVTTPGPHRFEVRIESIDDMGVDQLVHAIAVKNGESLYIRVAGDESVPVDHCFVTIDLSRAAIYGRHSGKRLGGWGASVIL